MKTLILKTLATLCVSGLLMSAAAQTATGQPERRAGNLATPRHRRRQLSRRRTKAR